MGTATAATEEKKTTRAQTCIVTARVPVEIREQVNGMLKEMGSTPTELVNAAYRYVLECGELPGKASGPDNLAGQRRSLSQEQLQSLRERTKRTSFDVPESFWQGKSDDELITEALEEKYESLA